MASADYEVITERSGGMEIMSTGALGQLAKAEVDMQIATAKRYPRDIHKSRDEAMGLATLDEDTATSMYYALPRGGKRILGPSSRLAEVIVYSWGNIRAQAIVTDIGEKFITALGTCLDLEKNVAAQVEVRRRITDRNGKRYDDDMIMVTGNAACSIAFRNAVFKVVPFALIKPIYDAAQETSVGKAKSMDERRRGAVEWFGKLGISEERILKTIGRRSMDEVTPDDLVVLKGLSTAIKDGDTTIEEAFPMDNDVAKAGSRASEIDERLAKSAKSGGAAKEAPKARKAAPAQKAEPEPEPDPPATEEHVSQTTGLVTQRPAGTPAPDSPFGEAIAEIQALIEDMAPKGGDAPPSLRKRIEQAAALLFEEGDESRAQIEALASHDDLGKAQANVLNSRLSMAVAAMEMDEGGESVEEPAAVAPKAGEPADPRLAQLNAKYFAILGERRVTDEERSVFQAGLLARGLVTSDSCKDWSKLDYQSATVELEKLYEEELV